MSDAPLLTVELLEELKARWHAQRVPLLNHLQPGLSNKRTDELTAPLGLRVPEEVRVWWGWHDGVPTEAIKLRSERQMTGTGWAFLPLAEAVQEGQNRRKLGHGGGWRSGRDSALARRLAAN